MSTFPPFREEHEIFRQSVRVFAEREIAPFSDQWDEKRYFSDERFQEKYGGQGLDYWYV